MKTKEEIANKLGVPSDVLDRMCEHNIVHLSVYVAMYTKEYAAIQIHAAELINARKHEPSSWFKPGNHGGVCAPIQISDLNETPKRPTKLGGFSLHFDRHNEKFTIWKKRKPIWFGGESDWLPDEFLVVFAPNDLMDF